MNNEPVAWMRPDTLECGYGGNVDWEDTGCIPLYTHPAKTLTDEEICEFAKEQYGDAVGLYNHIGFARAILRKAQE